MEPSTVNTQEHSYTGCRKIILEPTEANGLKQAYICVCWELQTVELVLMFSIRGGISSNSNFKLHTH